MKTLIVLAALLAIGCTDGPGATRVLREQGFTEIAITGYDAWLCGKEDYATGFTATSPIRTRVSGAVCSGVFKGYMIRFR